MVRYYDPQMLALANPANSKNELQAAGDAFKQMYKDYEMYKLSQDRLKMSNLEREYAEKTQDDRIKQSNLTTQGLQNKVDLSALELDTARKSQKDLLEGIRLDTLGKEQDLNKKIIENHFLPQEKKANINQANASASNLYANARLTNLKSNITQHEFNENKEAKSVLTDFNEFANNNPNLKGDDLKNAYAYNIRRKIYNELNNPLLDNYQRITNAQQLQDKLNNFNKYLPNIAQSYSISEQSFNPIPKGGGNGANASAIIGANLDEVRQAKEKSQVLGQENKAIEYELKKLKISNPNDPKIKELEQKRQELLVTKEKLDGFINTSQTPIFNYDLLSKEEAKVTRNTENEVIDTLGIAREIDEYLDFLNGKYVDKNGNKGQKFWTPNSGFWNNFGDKIVAGQGASENVRRFNALMTSLSRRNGSMRLKTEIDFLKNSITDPSDWWSWSSQVKNDLGRMKQSLIKGTLSEVERYKSTNPVFYDYITMKYPEIKTK